MTQNGKPKEKVEKKLWRLVDIFLPGDVASVKAYVLKQVIGPTLRKLLYDIIVGSSFRMIFPSGQPTNNSQVTGTNYASVAPSTLNGGVQATQVKITQTSWQYNQFPIIATRELAENTLNRLLETIQTYGVATVADFYDMIGVTAEPTASNWCWDDLSKADIIPVNNGYQIRFPKVKQLPR